MKGKVNWWLIFSIVLVLIVLSVVFGFTGNAVLRSSGKDYSGSLANECVSQCKNACVGSVIVKMRCRANCDTQCVNEANQQKALLETGVDNPNVASIESYHTIISSLIANRSDVFVNNTTVANSMAMQKNGKLISFLGHDVCGFSRESLSVIASAEFVNLSRERNLTILLLEAQTPESSPYMVGEIRFPSVKIWQVSVNGSGGYSQTRLAGFTFREGELGIYKTYSSFGLSSKCYSYSTPIELSVEGFMKVIDDTYNGGNLLKLTKQIPCS